MFALITFLIGVFLLFKGAFHLGSRTVAQRQSRTIAFILMAPFVLELCMSSVLVYNNIQINQDGTVGFSPDAFDYVANTLQTADLILVIGAAAVALYMIYGSAQFAGSAPSEKQKATSAPARTPDIMTVAEAAAYMRVSESDVMNLIDQGKLGAARIGSSYRIARIAIDDFISQSS